MIYILNEFYCGSHLQEFGYEKAYDLTEIQKN
jgi:hypothetical protein